MIQLAINDVINAADADGSQLHGTGTHPVASAQGFYGTAASYPNKSPRREPGDREPSDAPSRRLRSGLLFGRGRGIPAAHCLGGMPLPSLRLESWAWSVASISKLTVRTMPSA